jgi:hypothetical protein
MWNRTKRLINSYLDNLIDKVEKPDSEVREVTRAELTRLNEVEIQNRATAKVLEKQIAEVELKMTGLAERDRILQSRGQPTSATDTASRLSALEAERVMLVRQLAEANSAAERARALREERSATGEDLATQTHLTTMQERLASVQSGFGVNDPSAVIDEMRLKISKGMPDPADSRVAEADRELAREAKRSRVDDLLTQYKQNMGTGDLAGERRATAAPPKSSTTNSDQPAPNQSEDDQSQTKTLGRAEGPIRPVD